jgi:hypothetical protein
MAKQIPNNHFFFHVIFDFVKKNKNRQVAKIRQKKRKKTLVQTRTEIFLKKICCFFDLETFFF